MRLPYGAPVYRSRPPGGDSGASFRRPSAAGSLVCFCVPHPVDTEKANPSPAWSKSEFSSRGGGASVLLARRVLLRKVLNPCSETGMKICRTPSSSFNRLRLEKQVSKQFVDDLNLSGGFCAFLCGIARSIQLLAVWQLTSFIWITESSSFHFPILLTSRPLLFNRVTPGSSLFVTCLCSPNHRAKPCARTTHATPTKRLGVKRYLVRQRCCTATRSKGDRASRGPDRSPNRPVGLAPSAAGVGRKCLLCLGARLGGTEGLSRSTAWDPTPSFRRSVLVSVVSRSTSQVAIGASAPRSGSVRSQAASEAWKRQPCEELQQGDHHWCMFQMFRALQLRAELRSLEMLRA